MKYLIRYKFNTIFSILLSTLIFFAILNGFEIISDNYPSIDSKEKILSGYIVWIIMISNFTSIVNNFTTEMSLGTLEQLYLNSKNFLLVVLSKGLATLLISFIQFFILLLLIILIHKDFSFTFLIKYIISFPIIIIGIIAIWGLSLIVTSLALFYKNVSTLFSAISSILFAVISYSVHKSIYLTYFFPFGKANKTIQDFYSVSKYPTIEDATIIIVNSLVYLMIGMFAINFYTYKAKEFGGFAKH